MNCPADFKNEALSHVDPWTLGANYHTHVDPRIASLYRALGVKVVSLPKSMWEMGPAYNNRYDMIGKLPSRFFPCREVMSHVQLHELSHWTGHASRLGRLPYDPFTSEAPGPGAAKLLEESTAELSAITLLEHLSIKIPGEYAQLPCARLNSYHAEIPEDWWQSWVVSKAAKAVQYIMENGKL